MINWIPQPLSAYLHLIINDLVMRPLITTLAILLALTCSCEKKPTLEGEIHIFLLSDAATQDPLWETEESNLVRELVPLIEYKDILSYDSVDFIFKISNTAQENLEGQESNLHSRAFVVVANGENIYTGYFWASYSSASCPWLTIDPIHAQYSGELRTALGYPWLMEDMSIPDRRNDGRILSILRHDRKLIE